MSRLEVIVELDDLGSNWRAVVEPYRDDATNERFARALARGLTAEGWTVHVERTTQTREDVPL